MEMARVFRDAKGFLWGSGIKKNDPMSDKRTSILFLDQKRRNQTGGKGRNTGSKTQMMKWSVQML